MAQQLGLDLDDAPKAPRKGALRSAHLRGQPVPVAEALALEARASGQEECIVSWIRAQGPGVRFTPSDVHRAFPRLEITSIRRALTNLSTPRESRPARLVHYPTDRRPGPRGATESTWGLA